MKKYCPIIIVAVDEAGGFGKNGTIPWHLPEDIERFKTITQHHICVMGRHTYNDILAARKIRDDQNAIHEPITEILRNRTSFVVTSQDIDTPGAIKINNAYDVMSHVGADDNREIFVIGGKQMFIHALSWCEKIMMTVVKGTYNCDVFFPIDILNNGWEIVSGQESEKAYFVVYNKQERYTNE